MGRIVPKQALYQAEPRPAPSGAKGFDGFRAGAQEHKNSPKCGFGANLRHSSDTAVPAAFETPGAAYGDRAVRALELYADELHASLKAMPLTSPARAGLISRIRDVEDQIGWAQGL